jgi:hypothetical protein
VNEQQQGWTMILELIELIDSGIAEEVEGIFRKYRTGGNDIVVFWGDFGEDNLTIKRLENRALPVAVDLLDPELCVPSDYMKTKYQARWSVLEACEVVVL